MIEERNPILTVANNCNRTFELLMFPFRLLTEFDDQ
jgi:hypothetical protein